MYIFTKPYSYICLPSTITAKPLSPHLHTASDGSCALMVWVMTLINSGND